MRYHRRGKPSANERPDDDLVSWGHLTSLRFATGHGSVPKGYPTIRWVKWRMGVAFAGLLLTWALICGFVLLALAMGWRL